MNRSKEQSLLESGYRKVWLRELRKLYATLKISGQFDAAQWLSDYFIAEAEAAKRSYVLLKPGKSCDKIVNWIRDCKDGALS